MPTEDEKFEMIKEYYKCPICGVRNLQRLYTNAFSFTQCNSCGFKNSRPLFKIRHP